MKRTTKYVALDVHQATTVAAVREQSGRVIARSILPTESEALVEFFGGMRGSIHVAFEEGTQAQWLHDLLSPVVDRIIVCDRRGEHRGNKADQVDADKLSHRLLSGDLRAVYHGSSDRLTLQELTRTYMNLVEDSTRTMLRLKALFRARAIRALGTRIYGTKDRALWLTRLPDRGLASGLKRSTQRSMCFANCGPGPGRSWSSRHGVIPRGRSFSRFPSSGPFVCRYCWPP
jgi:hypothetical protein